MDLHGLAFISCCFLGSGVQVQFSWVLYPGACKAAIKVWARLHSFLKFRVIFQALGAIGRIQFFSGYRTKVPLSLLTGRPRLPEAALTQHDSLVLHGHQESVSRSCLPWDLREPWNDIRHHRDVWEVRSSQSPWILPPSRARDCPEAHVTPSGSAQGHHSSGSSVLGYRTSGKVNTRLDITLWWI